MRIKRQEEMKDECCVMCESSLKWIVFNKSVRDTDRERVHWTKSKTLSKNKRPRGRKTHQNIEGKTVEMSVVMLFDFSHHVAKG